MTPKRLVEIVASMVSEHIDVVCYWRQRWFWPAAIPRPDFRKIISWS